MLYLRTNGAIKKKIKGKCTLFYKWTKQETTEWLKSKSKEGMWLKWK